MTTANIFYLQATTDADLALTPIDEDEASSRIRVMQMQEKGVYNCGDYLGRLRALSDVFSKDEEEEQQYWPQESSLSPTTITKFVDEECRIKMVNWCFRVVDFCQFRRETVSIAMSYLDRFLETEYGIESLHDRKIFQLAAMTSLYMAVKIFEPQVMEPQIVSGLSRGSYTEQEVVRMEMTILVALRWRLNPPTALSFVSHLLSLFPFSRMQGSVRCSILDFARFQTELAISNYYFVLVKPSVTAFACVLNAIEAIGDSYFMEQCRASFIREVSKVTGMNDSMPQVLQAQKQLMYVMSNNRVCGFSIASGQSQATSPTSNVLSFSTRKGSGLRHSPRCVV